MDGRIVSVLGLAYKAGISDTRDSPSLKLMKLLLSEGARIKAFDQHVDKLELGEIELCSDLQSCLARSDCCIITTHEQLFRQVPRYLDAMNKVVVVDMVRLLDPKVVGKRALYAAVGLGSSAGG